VIGTVAHVEEVDIVAGASDQEVCPRAATNAILDARPADRVVRGGSRQIEAAYNQFGFTNGGGSINIPSFTGNVQYDLPLGMSFTPYAIGGVGLYRPSAGFNGGGSTSAENDFGWNIGGGIKIPLSTSFETFIEARYNSVNASGGTASFVPLTVGVMF